MLVAPLSLRPLAAGLLAVVVLAPAAPARAYVPLMAGQRAQPLNGTFNAVPVLHSNQPEEVEGPGILISTEPGVSYAAETGRALQNATYTFNGEFGVHLHHKYFPEYRREIRPQDRRTELTLGLILINPGTRPVTLQFERGAVRNSFQAPYLGTHKMGVRPLGPRPWNTGPGDATAVQMLRGSLDRELQQSVRIPPRSRIVLLSTQLPALGIANALLRGRSDGPFQMAVVAASNPRSNADLVAVLDSRRLAPGRVYLTQLGDIRSGRVFSRVGGVAIGDAYQASLRHDLRSQGPLHVPFTSTSRTNFGTRDVQVNPLAVRMIDSALDNVGTYGVRFDIDLDLYGNGPYELVMSHPTSRAGTPRFTAFRGSLQVRSRDGLEEMHLGMQSGESYALTTLNLLPNVSNPVRISLVYPADATPGHLLSVVPASQLAIVQARQAEELASAAVAAPAAAPQPQPRPRPVTAVAPAQPQLRPPAVRPVQPAPAQVLPPAQRQEAYRPPANLPQAAPVRMPGVGSGLLDRYQEAVEAQQEVMRGLLRN
ncbi:MAG: DUF3370 family protein [Cyanobacteria bacterium J06638_7]